jgi:hypothetical protein
MLEKIYTTIITSFVIDWRRFFPLLLVVDQLESYYSGHTQLNQLAWYEIVLLLTLLITTFQGIKTTEGSME